MFDPSIYKCSLCGATGVKLWRPWQNMDTLICAKCAEGIQEPQKSQTTELVQDRANNWIFRCHSIIHTAPRWEIDADGFIESPYDDGSFPSMLNFHLLLKDFGIVIPAIPFENDESQYYGYSSSPEELVKKWKALPTRK